MFPWLWYWAPQVHLPWSGNVAQQIDPDTTWFFNAIAPSAGDGRVEQRAVQVASYGRQLGLISELLLDLAAQTPPATPAGKKARQRLAEIERRIEAVKREAVADEDAELLARLKSLQRTDPAAFARLRAQLG